MGRAGGPPDPPIVTRYAVGADRCTISASETLTVTGTDPSGSLVTL
jgi:hypothetical protein